MSSWRRDGPRITPQQAGLPDYGGHRRVPGLRREEVALLAGVSVDYYTRLERGNARGVSDSVLEALARALQLDDAERAHLYDLVRRQRRRPRAAVDGRPSSGSGPACSSSSTRCATCPPSCRTAASTSSPPTPSAEPSTPTSSTRRTSPTGRRLPNHARFTFLDPRATDFYPDWKRAAADSVALLRAEAGRNPDDRDLNELIGELTTRSERFTALWATHNVRWHTTGTKRFHHRVVGDLALAYEGLELAGDPGQTLITFTAAPGSTSAPSPRPSSPAGRPHPSAWPPTSTPPSSKHPEDRLPIASDPCSSTAPKLRQSLLAPTRRSGAHPVVRPTLAVCGSCSVRCS